MRFTPILAIFAITGLEAFALYNGLNGVLLSATIAIIAGLGGYYVHQKVTK